MTLAESTEHRGAIFDELDEQWLNGQHRGAYPATSEDAPELSGEMSALDAYMTRLRELAPLSNEEQSELARRYIEEGDQKAGQLLVMTNLRLVIKLAKEYANDWDEILDLIQEGNVGISKALGHYDRTKNVKFTSYAQYWVRARILDYLINRGRTIRLGASRAGRKLFYNLNKVRKRLRDQGIDPTPARIAEELDVDEREVVRVGTHLDESPISLDQKISDDADQTIGDLMEADTSTPEDATASRESQNTVREALREFGEQLSDDRRRAIWYERTLADDPKLLRELGDQWDVSKERIRQLESGLHHEFRGYFKRYLGGAEELEAFLAD